MNPSCAPAPVSETVWSDTDGPSPQAGAFVVSGQVTMARMSVCNCVGCPAHDGSCPTVSEAKRCTACAGQYEARRGTRQARGYDRGYDLARKRWAPRVEAGLVDCHAPTCLMPARRIHLGAAWDLGHDEQRHIRGPEHSVCNRSAGGKAAHGG